jgi:protein TonB
MMIVVFLLWTGAFTTDGIPLVDAQAQNAAAGAIQREPIRVGGNIQETKLLKRVEPVYPELAKRARIEAIVMLQVTVNEQGLVSEAKVIRGHPMLDEAAISAVRQWEYSPTHLNGEAVTVIATVTVIFTLGPTPTRLFFDQSGLRRMDGSADLSHDALRENKGGVLINAAPQVSISEFEQILRKFQEQGIQNIQVTGACLYKAGQLYYAPGVLRGAERLLPPELNIDLGWLAAMARASANIGDANALSYRVFVSGSGRVVAVERIAGPDIPEVEAALSQAMVKVPGRFGNEFVPAAAAITILIK